MSLKKFIIDYKFTIFAILLFSPFYITITPDYNIVFNRVYHVTYNFLTDTTTYNKEHTNFIISLPSNLFLFMFFSLYFFKYLFRSNFLLVFSFLIFIICIFNFNNIHFLYKNSISMILFISSTILFDRFHFSKNNLSIDDIIINPLLIVMLLVLLPTFIFYNPDSSFAYIDQVYYYFLPFFIAYDFNQYFTFIFLILVSFNYKNIFILLLINIIVFYINFLAANFTALGIIFIFNSIRIFIYFTPLIYKEFVFKSVKMVLFFSIFLYFIILSLISYNLITPSLLDRYIFFQDYIANANFISLLIPFHTGDINYLVHGLHNQFLEIFSRFGILVVLLYYFFILKKIKHIERKFPLISIFFYVLLFIGCSTTNVFTHPFTLLCFSFMLSFFTSRISLRNS